MMLLSVLPAPDRLLTHSRGSVPFLTLAAINEASGHGFFLPWHAEAQ